MDDVITEVQKTITRGDRILITTLTKKLAEELRSSFLTGRSGPVTSTPRSRHSSGPRSSASSGWGSSMSLSDQPAPEGLDIPEVGFIGILDADKEGFLRDARSLIQIIGRAARNVNSKVVLYADTMTDSMKRRLPRQSGARAAGSVQQKNTTSPADHYKTVKEKEVDIRDTRHVPKPEIPNMVIELEKQMQDAADNLDFERAIALRIRSKN